MANKKSYTEKVEALIKGDAAKDIAVKNQKQLASAIKSQLAMKEATRMDKEDAIENAREEVEKTLLNNGKAITAKDREDILQKYYNAKHALERAEDELVNHDKEVDWLNEANELIK